MFGKRLKKLRKDRQYTISKMSLVLEISVELYLKYERDELHPNLPILIKVACTFHVSIDYLAGLTNLPLPYPEAEKYLV